MGHKPGGAFLFLLFLALPAQAALVETRQVDGGWQLTVDGKPYFIRGVDYRVAKVGESPDQGTHRDWAWYDHDGNGKNDAAHDAWVDLNGDGAPSGDEPAVGDFELLRRMGANTLRWYVNDFPDQKPNKELLRELFEKHGIRVAVGNKFGAYTIDSGASWESGTDYRNPAQRKAMLASVRRMVLEHKDEPYTLLWLLGNENNLRFTNTNAAAHPEEYARFVNEAAELIHSLDPSHPVALVNGDLGLVRTYSAHAPAVDILGVNAYRGISGFGGLWKEAREAWDRPLLITEYGGSYAPGLNEDLQAEYHANNWEDIERNRAGGPGAGNAVGGFAFEWLDEWWKAGDPGRQAAPGTTGRVGVDEPRWTQEYCGIVSQGDGGRSPFLRRLRKVYFMYQKRWAREVL